MEGAIAAVGFRTDGEAVLATGSADGDLAFWDLNSRGRLVHLVRNAHEGGVSTVEWIPGQSLLVTSGGDNAIRVRPPSSVTLPAGSPPGPTLTSPRARPSRSAMDVRDAPVAAVAAQVPRGPPRAAVPDPLLRRRRQGDPDGRRRPRAPHDERRPRLAQQGDQPRQVPSLILPSRSRSRDPSSSRRRPPARIVRDPNVTTHMMCNQKNYNKLI